MSFCIPLKRALEVEKSTVGQKLVNSAMLESSLNLPFSMIITSDAFDEFVKYNQLAIEIEEYRNASSTAKKIKIFTRLVTSFKNAHFPHYVVDELKECFELVSLDTTNLSNLSTNQSDGLLLLRRSTNHEDIHNKSSKMMVTKETFKQFLETIKKMYMGAFVPSANIEKEPKIAIVVSRTPPLKVTVETKCDFSKDMIEVKSYFGFPDMFDVVEKNKFKVGLDFLKIHETSIPSQSSAVVFNQAENNTTVKKFSTENSSQTIPDQIVLESARLTKLIGKITKANVVNASFFVSGEDIKCVNVDVEYNSSIPVHEKEYEITKRDDLIFDPVKKIQIEDVLQDDVSKNLIQSLKRFLDKYKTTDIAPSIPILLRALDDPVKNSVIKSLEICKEIYLTFEEKE